MSIAGSLVCLDYDDGGGGEQSFQQVEGNTTSIGVYLKISQGRNFLGPTFVSYLNSPLLHSLFGSTRDILGNRTNEETVGPPYSNPH